MNQRPLAASLIIPTRNRGRLLERLLPSWAEQVTSDAYEVIIADNGSTDDTIRFVREATARWPHVRLINEPNIGGARARHTGALQAQSPFLVFVDDDMRADPRLVAEHLHTHRESPASVIVGNIISAPGRHPFDRMMAYVYDGPKQTLANREPGAHDYWSGNASLSRELYLRMGGYTHVLAQLRCGEDMDFGIRLKAAGVKLVFAPDAVTYHHFTEKFRDRLDRSHRQGIAWAYLKVLYPDLQIDIAKPARGIASARIVELCCRALARVIEPFDKRQGVPRVPLAYIYALGIRTALGLGIKDYEVGRSRLSRELKRQESVSAKIADPIVGTEAHPVHIS